MLDMDDLAARRARDLNQAPEIWREAVWKDGFQKLSQNMSDGEVEALISFCTSVDHFEALVGFLFGRCQKESSAPFAVLTAEAHSAGVTPEQWVKAFK